MPGSDIPHLFDLGASWYVCRVIEPQNDVEAHILPAISVFTDLVCSLLPFPILWSLQLSPRKKIAVGVLMALGTMCVLLLNMHIIDTANASTVHSSSPS